MIDNKIEVKNLENVIDLDINLDYQIKMILDQVFDDFEEFDFKQFTGGATNICKNKETPFFFKKNKSIKTISNCSFVMNIKKKCIESKIKMTKKYC